MQNLRFSLNCLDRRGNVCNTQSLSFLSSAVQYCIVLADDVEASIAPKPFNQSGFDCPCNSKKKRDSGA